MPRPQHILGLSAFYHDSAACLVRDGQIFAAAQEERFSRRKNDEAFPRQAVSFCLTRAAIEPAELDAVVFYDKPIRKFSRLLETYLAVAPDGWRTFARVLPSWFSEKLDLRKTIRAELPRLLPDCPILFTEHHVAHAASAFYPSPFSEAAILTVDGVGEWATTAIARGEGDAIRMLEQIRFPHSLGLLYSAFTAYCGFRINSGEYKLMGLAPYGEPRYAPVILDTLLDLKPDGSFRLNLEFFDFLRGFTMTNDRFHRLFGGPPRAPEGPLEPRHADVARSIQAVTEEVMIRLARHARELTGLPALCLAGGVALNCVANGQILRSGLFDRLWIQPAAGDAGGALGAALEAWHRHRHAEPDHAKPHRCHSSSVNPGAGVGVVGGGGDRIESTRAVAGNPVTASNLDRITAEYLDEWVRTAADVRPTDAMQGAQLGPEYGDAEIETVLKTHEAVYRRLDRDDLLRRVVQFLIGERVVGWFQGRLEFGPRALGNRSILGDPRSARMQSVMNLKVKFRESFRPFAPVVMLEHAAEYFDLDTESPYMLLVASVRPELRRPVDAGLRGFDRLKAVRSTLPAITHVDDSARIQTVTRAQNPLLYDLLRTWREATGCAVLVNTSFNVRGEPLVATPDDAYRCFVNTEMDNLAIGSFLLDRTAQPRRNIERRVAPQAD
jgi:carbamoyltransferase